MNSSTASTPADEPIAKPRLTPDIAVAPAHTLGSDLSQLTKARLTGMLLITTLAGYWLANRGPLDLTKLFHTLLGTALVAICSSILNQALERDVDSRMRRTETRPLVTRRLPFVPTLIAGLALGGLGLVELTWFVNALTALLAFGTLAIYVLVYTPLKKVTALNTLVGTIPGALPPLLGATAARGNFSAEGWALFALLAFWQLPHFYAIAWLYQDDYRAAGLRMVSVDDASGKSTGRHALISAVLLLGVSLYPTWLPPFGTAYLVMAGLLSGGFVYSAARFARQTDRPHARALFLYSIAYLPLILLALVVTRAL